MTDKDLIKQAIAEVLDEKLAHFWIEREKHYRHHLWIDEMIAWMDQCKSTIVHTVTRCLVTALIGFIVMGFIFWNWRNLKG